MLSQQYLLHPFVFSLDNRNDKFNKSFIELQKVIPQESTIYSNKLDVKVIMPVMNGRMPPRGITSAEMLDACKKKSNIISEAKKKVIKDNWQWFLEETNSLFESDNNFLPVTVESLI